MGLQIYRQIGEKYGVKYSEDEILSRYRRAYEQPWGRSRLRFAIFEYNFGLIPFIFAFRISFHFDIDVLTVDN